jgi:hypothetical protein
MQDSLAAAFVTRLLPWRQTHSFNVGSHRRSTRSFERLRGVTGRTCAAMPVTQPASDTLITDKFPLSVGENYLDTAVLVVRLPSSTTAKK